MLLVVIIICSAASPGENLSGNALGIATLGVFQMPHRNEPHFFFSPLGKLHVVREDEVVLAFPWPTARCPSENL